ncbi:twitchin-like isoform X3 [Gigantopelta aegis]|uniref:twitchin-like isoform X3 n=1 Tax=Gigantopelta aegis TaxID=1735272 RepID=UPI001B888A2B|nr:twitchin-like isoform X3 [Gigantopelta aegis]
MGVGDDIAPRFTQKPSLKQEDNGQRLVFQCALEASPKPEILWFRGDTALSNSDRIKMRVDPAGGGSAFNVILEIFGVGQNDAGTYKVVAKNRLGEVSASINLNFSAGQQKQQDGIAPNFIQKPVTRQADNGKTLFFECLLTADPAPAISWFRDAQPIQQGARYKIKTEARDQKQYFVVLEINDVSAQDGGNYKVTAKNALGESNATIRLNFDSSETSKTKGTRPVFIQKPVIRQVGDKIVIECKLTAEPKPTIQWLVGNQEVVAGGRINKTHISDGANHTITLEIAQVNLNDGGEYKAIAKNANGEAIATITLNFEGAKKPEIPEGKAPHFLQKPTIKQEQKLLIMTCMLEAKPTPQIRWFRDQTEVGEGGRFTISLQRDPSGADTYTAILQIKEPTLQDGGAYKCTAANDFGESNANITLNFQGGEKKDKPPGGIAPTFTEKPRVTQEAGGKNIVIICKCTANPKPTISWFKGTTPLATGPRVNTTMTSEGDDHTIKMEIKNFTPQDGGAYKVTAKNEMGEGNANITINLEAPKPSPPKIEGKPNIRLEDQDKIIVIDFAVVSAEKPDVEWFFGNTPIKSGGRFVIDVGNEKGVWYPTLEIENYTNKDSGTYKCIVKNAGGEATVTAALNVEQLKPKVKGEPPKFVQKLSPKSVTDGDAVDFVAKISGTEPIEILWSKDKKPLKNSDIYEISYDKGVARLYLSEVFPEDGGNYAVDIKNKFGSANSMASLQVKEGKTETKEQTEMKIEMKSKKTEQKPEEPKEEAKPEPKKEKSPAKPEPAKPKEKTPPKQKPIEEEKSKAEQAVKKDKSPKPTAPPQIIEPVEEAPADKNSGKGNPKSRNPKTNKKDNPGNPKDSEEDSSKPHKTKLKAYQKKPTTILEEADEEVSDGYEADDDRPPSSNIPNNGWDDSDDVKTSMNDMTYDSDGRRMSKTAARPPDGPIFKKKPINQTIVEGDNLKVDLEIDLQGKPMPAIRFYRAGRELREDTRTAISTDPSGKATLLIKKTRITDEAKYSVVLEQDGMSTDTATFSIFIKDPKDSSLDFRSLLKHREQNKKQADDDDVDWGSLKPEMVDRGRRPSQIELMRMQLKKVEKEEGSDSEGEKERHKHERQDYVRADRSRSKMEMSAEADSQSLTMKDGSRRQSIEMDVPIKMPTQEKLEAMEQQRRSSMQTRRASLAEVIPDWPTLQKRKVVKEDPDKFLTELHDVKTVEGVPSIKMTCVFCKPNAKLSWLKNKLEIFHGYKYHFENNDKEYSLMIMNVKPEDAGKYSCLCNDCKTAAWLYVEAKEPEYYFTQKLPQHYEVCRKKNGMLECFLSDSRARVKWYKMGEPLEYTPGKYEIQRRENRCILRILNAAPEDEGEYMCKCGDAVTACDVYCEEPEWEFMKKLDDVEAVERERAMFECDVSDPEADVTWFKEEKELKSGGKYEFQKDNLKRRLIIKNCSAKDDGKYTCKLLDQTTTAELYVSPDVKFIKKLEPKTVKEGDNLTLECKATNAHKHPSKWFKNGQPFEPDLRGEITQKGESYKLVIKNVIPDDMAEYTLQIGERPTRSVVTVVEPPKPPKIDVNAIPKEIFVKEGELIELKIPFVGSPMPRATWKKGDKQLSEADMDIETEPRLTKLLIPNAKRSDTGTYELTLTNDSGQDTVPIKVTVMGPPEKPKGPLDVLDIYCDRCALMWEVPEEDGGAPVTGYLVEKMDSATGEWEKVCETDDLEVDVSDLTPGHRYQFRVSAINSEGISKPLDSGGEILAKDPWDPPDPAGTPEVMDYDKDYVEIGWDPPKSDNGAPIQAYLIQYKEKDSDEWKKGPEVPSADTCGTVKGLKEGKEYDFRVIARNKAGPSEPSECTTSPVLRARKVKPRIDRQTLPKNIKVKAGQELSLPVEFIGEPSPKAVWTLKPLKGDNKELAQADNVTIKTEPKKSTLTIPKATRKDTGQYTISIANKHGDDSEMIDVVILGPPLRPMGPLEVKDINKDSVTLKWKPPEDDGGNELTGYRVEKLDMKKGRWEKVADVTGQKCVVPKLTEGNEYKFRVIAENKNGESEPLETEKAVTAKKPFDEATPPSQPEIIDTDRTHIDLKWEPPEDDGGAPVTDYDIERKDAKSNRWVKINKAPVKGLTYKDDKVKDGNEYQYRIIANNEAGPSDPSLPSKTAVAKPMKEAPKVNLDSLFGAKEIRVRAGEPLNIELGICGAPEPTVEWTRNGKPVGSRPQMTSGETQAKLHIPRAERGDTGKYTIKVANAHGEDTADIKVIVLDKPGAPEGPLSVSDVTAETAKISWKEPEDNGGAEITGYVVEKCEEGSTYWEKVPGMPTGTSHTVKGLQNGKTYQFRVKAENIYGVGEPLVGSKVLAKNPFDAPDAPRDLEIDKFDRFSCSLQWKPPTSDGGNPIKGYLVEKRERGKDWVKASIYPVPDTNFTVLNLVEGTQVEFRVSAINESGPGKSSKVSPSHTVRDPIFPAGSPPQPNVDKITKNSVGLSWDKPKNDGGAKITGYVIEKKKPGEDWMECLSLPASQTSGTVPNLQQGEEYQFRVRAVNAAGLGEPSRPTNSIKAEDQPEKPKLDMSRVKDITVKAGQEFQIVVPFTATPKPKATWNLGDNTVDDSPRTTVKVDDNAAILAVAKAKREDAGRYTLTLKNPSGQETGSLNVNVLDKPLPPGGPITASDMDGQSMTLSWKPPADDGGEPVGNYIVEKKKEGTNRWQKVSSFVSKPTCTVRNLEPGTKYEFRVMAENGQGISEPLETDEAILSKLPFDAPGSPGSPKCMATTEDSITLSWTPPKRDGGSPITGYLIEKKEKGDKKWTKANIGEVSDNEYTVKGLVEGKEYEFRVCAINQAGPGDFSECSDRIKPKPPPMAPKISRDFISGRDIIAKAGEPFKISIPYSGNPIPTVAWSQGGLTVPETERVKFENTPTNIILQNKKAERSDAGKYSVLLTNEKGTDSATVNVIVVDVPCKPEGPLEVSDVTPDGCILKWNPPKEDGGSPVSNYVVEKQDLRTGNWEPVSRFVRGTKYEVMGLVEGHEYNFRVMAENEHGVSEPLETVSSTAAQYPYTIPDSPSQPDVLDIDEQSVTLSWGRPKNDGGKKIQGYVIEYKEPTSNRWKTFNDIPIKETTGTVSGLNNDTDYEFRIRAKNVAGLGNPSTVTDPIRVKAKYTKPSVPGVPSPVNVGRTFVELSWDKPRTDGGSKITGYIVEKKEKGATMWTKATDYPVIDNNYTVANLMELSEYEFRVIAVNAAGKSEPSLESAPIKVKEKVVGTAPDFVKKLQNTKAPLGGEAVFTIQYTAHPEPDVYWYKNGIEMGSSGRNRIKKDGDIIVLTMNDLYEKDAGEIICELVNPLGRESCKCKLEVQVPPKLEKDIKDQQVQKGDQFKIKIPFSGTGPFEFKVKKNNKDLLENDRIKISTFDDYVTLIIKDVDPDDTASYKVEISNDSGTVGANFGLKVVSPPGSPTGPLNVSDITKNACRLAWKPPKEDGGGKITSYLVERQEVGKPYWITVSSHCKDTSIDVQGLYENHQYLFRVCAINEHGEGDHLQAENPIVAKMPFDAPDTPGIPEVTEVGGDFVSLTWEKPRSDGGGRITGYWIEKREHGTDNWSRVNLNPCITNMINIPNLIEDRRYEFRVFAENESGMSKPSMASNSVKIKDPKAAVIPEFTSQLRKAQAVEGKSARFECICSGQPAPDIQWFKGSREIFDSDKFEISSEGDKQILVVRNVYGEDADEYSCRASNRGGSRTSRAELEIRSPPKVNVPPRFRDICTFEKGESVLIKIPFTGNPKPDVKWIRDGTELRSGGHYVQEVTERHAILTIKEASKMDDGPYRLQLENELGADSAIIKVQVNDRPDPPQYLKMENIRDESVVLSWKPPLNDGGSFITAYIVEKREPPSMNWTRAASTRFAFHNVTGLTPEKEYEFRVMAENFYGRSDPCESTGPIKTDIPEEARKKKEMEGSVKKITNKKTNHPQNTHNKTKPTKKKKNIYIYKEKTQQQHLSS